VSRHFLVIGAQRCGTTWLATQLDAQPGVAMARPVRPEPKVFLADLEAGHDLAWYERTFFGHASEGQVLGEKSTSYLDHPAAAARAARVLGEAEIVALLRDPVERAVSNWRFSTDHGLETRPLETALRETLAGPAPWDPAGTSVSPFAYLERGRYAEALEPWLAAFPATTHVVLLADLLADDAAVGGLYAALGVDASYRPPGRGRPVNRSTQPRPDLPEDLLQELRDHFSDSDDELARMLGRDLPWRPRPAAAPATRGATHA
jgi:hypothetical protein